MMTGESANQIFRLGESKSTLSPSPENVALANKPGGRGSTSSSSSAAATASPSPAGGAEGRPLVVDALHARRHVRRRKAHEFV